MKLCDRCRVKNCGLLYLGEGCQTVREKECPDIIPKNGDLLSVMDAGEMAKGIMALVNDLYQDEIPREEDIQEWLEMEAAKRLTETGYFTANGDLSLDSCPFCGSSDVVYERYLHTAGYRWRVVCMSCMASIDPGYAQQRSMVQRMWNTRAPILSAEETEVLDENRPN